MRQNMLCLAQRDLCGTCAGQAGASGECGGGVVR